MASRRSYADDLGAAQLPLPEHAMSRPVHVYGLDLIPTQPRGLLQHKKGVYKHSLQFQVGLSGEPVEALHRAVMSHLKASGCNVRKPDDYLAVLQNLCVSFAQARCDSVAYGVPVLVTFSLHRSAYTPQVSLAESLPGQAVVKTLTTALQELGVVEVTTSRVVGQLSTIVPTPSFLPFDADLTPIILSHSGQVCVMSARTKEKGEKKLTGGTTKTGRPEMRTRVLEGGHQRVPKSKLARACQRRLERESRKLTDINSLASRCRLALCDAVGWRAYFAGNLLLHAVWNDGDTEHGGRNYCNVQNLPARCVVPIRETLQMGMDGGELRALVEVDYKNLHIRMLYALVRHVLTDNFDCYDIEIPGWPKCPAQRDFLKVLLLALPNCGSPDKSPEENLQTAHAMARKQYGDWSRETYEWFDEGGNPSSCARRIPGRGLPDGVTPAKIVDAILAAHQPIAKHLYTGKGLELQAVDGQIARDILHHFAVKGVPVICVHDSFMIWPEYEDELVALMKSEYRQQMQAAYPADYDGSDPVPEIKQKKRKDLPPIPDLSPIVGTRLLTPDLDAMLAKLAGMQDALRQNAAWGDWLGRRSSRMQSAEYGLRQPLARKSSQVTVQSMYLTRSASVQEHRDALVKSLRAMEH